MDILPKELLHVLFTYLRPSDLFSLSLTCKTFNEIISNSTKLLEDFELQFNCRNANNEWIGSRKYIRCFIDGPVGVNYFYILKKIGNDLEDLVINCDDMRVDILKQILLMAENVKNLTVYNASDISEPEDYGYPFVKYNLKHFYFQGDINVFKLFIECDSECLDVRRTDDDDYRDVSGLKTFLKNQKHLINLKMEAFNSRCSLFSDEMLTSVDFKLKTLKLKYFNDGGFNFWEFLEHHKDTLELLEAWTVDHEIISTFRRFKNLKTIKLCSMCSDFSPLYSIENLYLKDVNGNWSEKFPNTKNLVISQNVFEIKQVESLKKLENLKISNSSIPILIIPKVKHLTLNSITLEESKPFEYENGCAIEELKIIKCKNLEWLIDFLIHKTFNLKSLVILKSILVEDDIKFIEDYRNKLNKLEITKCFGITDEDVDNDEEYWDEDFSVSESEVEDGEEEEEDESDEESTTSSTEEEGSETETHDEDQPQRLAIEGYNEEREDDDRNRGNGNSKNGLENPKK